MATKFYHCDICGNIMAAVIPSGATPFCCDCKMDEMTAQSTDQGAEKHVPVVTRLNSYTIKVTVGSDPHPMDCDHHICFVVVETYDGSMIKYLSPKDKAEVTFLTERDPIAVYAYCNKHGLWRTLATHK